MCKMHLVKNMRFVFSIENKRKYNNGCFLKEELKLRTHLSLSLSLLQIKKWVKYWFIQSTVAFSLKKNTFR